MFGLLEKLLRRKPAGEPAPTPSAAGSREVDDMSWFFPPSTVSEAAPWDEYWRNQILHKAAGWVHLFVDDGFLIDAMRANGLRTVLCVGNGLSLEARALAWAGFEVTALDLSPFALAAAEQAQIDDEGLARLCGGRTSASGGAVQFVPGDLRDPACCLGPFDVILERKTLQLFPDEERPAAIQAVVDRLASRGLFFSHCHDGRWRPGRERVHRVGAWFESRGWSRFDPSQPLAGRVYEIFLSTG